MTDLAKEEELTKRSYNKTAPLWSAAHLTYGYWADELKLFKELLPEGKILEIGCGGGRDARDLTEAGYGYLGTDISEGLVKEARKNNPKAAFEVFSLYDLNFKDKFDGFWCSAVLIHVPKQRIDEALRSIKRNIKAGGIGLIVIKRGKGEQIERREEFGGQKFFFTFWENNEFKKKLSENGYEVIAEGYRPVSKRSKWLTYHVRVQ